MQSIAIRHEGDFNSVYKSLLEPLTRVANNLMDNEDEAKELVNDVFIKMLKLDKSFGSEKEMKYYALACTRNACYNRLKLIKRRKDKQLEALWYFNSTQDTIDTIDAPVETVYDMIRNAVTALDVQFKPVVWQYYYEDRSCDEIAQKLKLTIDCVRYRLKAGRKLIKAAVL